MWIVCLADNSHEISRLVFFEKLKKNKNKCPLLQILLGPLRVKFLPHSCSKNWTSTMYNLLLHCMFVNCWMTGKQCRPWWDATFCSYSSGSTLFAQACLSEYFRYIWYVAFWLVTVTLVHIRQNKGEFYGITPKKLEKFFMHFLKLAPPIYISIDYYHDNAKY